MRRTPSALWRCNPALSLASSGPGTTSDSGFYLYLCLLNCNSNCPPKNACLLKFSVHSFLVNSILLFSSITFKMEKKNRKQNEKCPCILKSLLSEYILAILRFHSYSFDHFCATQRSRPPNLYAEGRNFKAVCGSASSLTWEASHGPTAQTQLRSAVSSWFCLQLCQEGSFLKTLFLEVSR